MQSGEVTEVGSAVNAFKVCDRVVAFKDDDFGFGGHAEFTAMPQHGLISKVPDHMSYAEAASAFEGARYALFYIRAAGVTEGSSVRVDGGTGNRLGGNSDHEINECKHHGGVCRGLRTAGSIYPVIVSGQVAVNFQARTG